MGSDDERRYNKFFLYLIYYQLMPNSLQLLAQLDLQPLDQEYPGLASLGSQADPAYFHKLEKLAHLIKYNIPKSFYSQEILDLDAELQELYEDMREGGPGEAALLRLPDRMTRKSCGLGAQSQDPQAQSPQPEQQQPQRVFSIAEIQRFVLDFNLEEGIRFVNRDIVREVQEMASARRQKAEYNLQEHKQRTQRKPHPGHHKTHQNTHLHNTHPHKMREQHPRKPKEQITITIGDKIPLEVREMRNYVKLASKTSFTVRSQLEEENKEQIEKQKTHILLVLNKVAPDNLHHMFEELESLVTGQQQLAVFLADSIIVKCLNEFKMIAVYLNFFAYFTKISEGRFAWHFCEIESQQRSRLNSFHRIFVQRLEQVFMQCLQDTSQYCKLKSLSYVIGMLVHMRKLSRKIYLHANKLLVQRLLQFTTGESEAGEHLFEAQIELIGSLGSMYEDIWGSHQLGAGLGAAGAKFLQQNKITNMKQFLKSVNAAWKFSTTRIKCLIQNLFQRKQGCPSSESRQQTTQNNCQQIRSPEQEQTQAFAKLLSQPSGLEPALVMYCSQPHPHLLTPLLLSLCSGPQPQVQQQTLLFLTRVELPKTQFLLYWQHHYMEFVLQECDLPFMTAVLGILAVEYLGEDCGLAVLGVTEVDPDREDVEVFMGRLRAKIQHYEATEDRDIFH